MILLARIACGCAVAPTLALLRVWSLGVAPACGRSVLDEACEPVLPDAALAAGVAVFDCVSARCVAVARSLPLDGVVLLDCA
ncbi:MAG TPA: hypothetical protein VGE10_03305 [Zeimonas sp.]